jgi:hypothetical protein
MSTTLQPVVSFTAEERAILIELLEHARRELPIQIRHSDCRSWREELRSRLDIVEKLLERLRTGAG